VDIIESDNSQDERRKSNTSIYEQEYLKKHSSSCQNIESKGNNLGKELVIENDEELTFNNTSSIEVPFETMNSLIQHVPNLKDDNSLQDQRENEITTTAIESDKSEDERRKSNTSVYEDEYLKNHSAFFQNIESKGNNLGKELDEELILTDTSSIEVPFETIETMNTSIQHVPNLKDDNSFQDQRESEATTIAIVKLTLNSILDNMNVILDGNFSKGTGQEDTNKKENIDTILPELQLKEQIICQEQNKDEISQIVNFSINHILDNIFCKDIECTFEKSLSKTITNEENYCLIESLDLNQTICDTKTELEREPLGPNLEIIHQISLIEKEDSHQPLERDDEYDENIADRVSETVCIDDNFVLENQQIVEKEDEPQLKVQDCLTDLEYTAEDQCLPQHEEIRIVNNAEQMDNEIKSCEIHENVKSDHREAEQEIMNSIDKLEKVTSNLLLPEKIEDIENEELRQVSSNQKLVQGKNAFVNFTSNLNHSCVNGPLVFVLQAEMLDKINLMSQTKILIKDFDILECETSDEIKKEEDDEQSIGSDSAIENVESAFEDDDSNCKQDNQIEEQNVLDEDLKSTPNVENIIGGETERTKIGMDLKEISNPAFDTSEEIEYEKCNGNDDGEAMMVHSDKCEALTNDPYTNDTERCLAENDLLQITAEQPKKTFAIDSDLYRTFAEQQRLLNFEQTHHNCKEKKNIIKKEKGKKPSKAIFTNLDMNGYKIKFYVPT